MDEQEERPGPDGDAEAPAPADDAREPLVTEPETVVYERVVDPEPVASAEPVASPGPVVDTESVVEPEPVSEPVAYEEVPTVAHAVFAPPTAAESTFAAAPGAFDAEPDDEEEGDDDDERKGVSFGTKALIVGAAWVLLVLFLIGQFSDDDDGGSGPVGIDQSGDSADGAQVAAGEGSELGDEEPVDVDGDGEIEPGEPGFDSSGTVDGASTGAGSGGGTTGSGGSGGVSGGSFGGGSGEGSGGDAAPVSIPGGSTGATTTTTKPAGGGGGGTTSTTTTAKPGGGSTTTAPASTTTQPGTPAPVTINVDRDGSAPEFSKSAQSLDRGGSIRFVNKDSSAHTLSITGVAQPLVLPANGEVSFQFTDAGDYTVSCAVPGHKGTLAVTVS